MLVVGTMEVDYRVYYYDVITNPRWRTDSKWLYRHISVINDPMRKFGTLVDIKFRHTIDTCVTVCQRC